MDSNFVFTERVKKLMDKGMVYVIRNEITIKFGGPDERVVLACGTNGYGCSIIRHHGSYGYEQGLWELAVISNIRGNNFDLDYDTDITQDVEGYLTCEEACKLIEDICRLDSFGRLPISDEESPYRQEVIDKLWEIAKISPEHGNILMDIIGDDAYNLVMREHTSKPIHVFGEESLEKSTAYHKGYLDALNKVANYYPGGIEAIAYALNQEEAQS